MSKKNNPPIKNDFSVAENEILEECVFTDGEVKIKGDVIMSLSFEEPSKSIDVCDNATNNLSNASLTNNESVSSCTPCSTNTLNVETNVNKTFSNTQERKENLDNRTFKSNPNGRTPPVDGESFDMRRTYALRRSTVRILSKIKAIHKDDNVYMNTIVDESIRYYYEFMKNSNE